MVAGADDITIGEIDIMSPESHVPLIVVGNGHRAGVNCRLDFCGKNISVGKLGRRQAIWIVVFFPSGA